MTMFLPLRKADEATQTVWARATAEEVDKAKEILDYVSAKPAFETWSKGFSDATLGKSKGNVRAMHSPNHLAGKVQEIVYNDAEKAIDVLVKVLDPHDWIKVQEGGYTGLSIGGGYAKKWMCPLHKGVTRYTPRISEISLVDSPCLHTALLKLEMQKRDGSVEEILLKGVPRSFNELLPPPSFNDLLGKSVLTATSDFMTRVKAHPAVNIAQGALKLGATMQGALHVGAVGAGAVGGVGGYFAVHHARQKKELAKPAYMKKSLAGTVGGFATRALASRAGQLATRAAAHPVGRMAAHVGEDVFNHAVLAGVGVGAWQGAKAVGRTFSPAKPKDPSMPNYMQKSLGELGAKAGRFAASYASAGRSALSASRIGQKAIRVGGKVAANPRVSAATQELKHAGWTGVAAPLHTTLRTAVAAAGGGTKARQWAGRAGLAADYAPLAYTAGRATGVLSDEKPAKKSVAVEAIEDRMEKIRGALGVFAAAANPFDTVQAHVQRLGAETRARKALARAPKNPSMPNYMQKSAIAEAIDERMEKANWSGLASAAGRRVGALAERAVPHLEAAAERAAPHVQAGLAGVRRGAARIAAPYKAAEQAIADKAINRSFDYTRGKSASVRTDIARTTGRAARWGTRAAVGGAAVGAGALAMPNHMKKSAITEAIEDRMEKAASGFAGHILGRNAAERIAGVGTGALFGAGLGALRGRKPAKEHSTAGHLAWGALAGGPTYLGYRAGRALVAKDPASHAMPAHMKKSDAELFLDSLDKRSSLGHKVKVGAAIGGTLGAVSGLAGGVRGAVAGAGFGALQGAAIGGIVHAVTRERPKKQSPLQELYAHSDAWDRANAKEAHTAHASLSDKEHAQRVAAAKARWMHEGHHDLDVHFAQQTKKAYGSFLGAPSKVAALQHQRHTTWKGVADAQDAYDKLRQHIHPDAHAMIEVPHAGGLLYNPQGVGEHHFDHNGAPKQPLYMLHPGEVDDFIKEHGKGAGVTKATPAGLLTDIRDLGTIVGHANRQFVRLEVA